MNFVLSLKCSIILFPLLWSCTISTSTERNRVGLELVRGRWVGIAHRAALPVLLKFVTQVLVIPQVIGLCPEWHQETDLPIQLHYLNLFCFVFFYIYISSRRLPTKMEISILELQSLMQYNSVRSILSNQQMTSNPLLSLSAQVNIRPWVVKASTLAASGPEYRLQMIHLLIICR